MASKTENSSRILRRNVNVHLRDKSGRITGTVRLKAGQEVPEEYEDLVTAEAAFVGEDLHSPGNPGERIRTNYNKMKVEKLVEIARDRGLQLPPNVSKKKLIEVLTAAEVTDEEKDQSNANPDD